MKEIYAIYRKAINEILEKMAFMFSEDAEKEDIFFPVGDTAVKAIISFTGELTGKIEIVTCRELCVVIAKNTLGIENNGFDQNTPYDALKEFANMVCGEFIELAQMSNKQLQMGIPEIKEVSNEEWVNILNDSNTLLFKVEDDFPLLARLSIRN
jgi:CheY-specific phosphatase CheX